ALELRAPPAVAEVDHEAVGTDLAEVDLIDLVRLALAKDEGDRLDQFQRPGPLPLALAPRGPHPTGAHSNGRARANHQDRREGWYRHHRIVGQGIPADRLTVCQGLEQQLVN